MEIRKLKTRDVKTIAGIIGRLNPDKIGQITGLARAESNRIELALAILRLLDAQVTDDIFAWLADMAGMTAAEFDDSEPAVLKAVVTGVIEQAGFKDFLSSLGTGANSIE